MSKVDFKNYTSLVFPEAADYQYIPEEKTEVRPLVNNVVYLKDYRRSA
jgi:hypothetical protein